MSVLIYPKSDKRLISSFDGEHARHEKVFTKKAKKKICKIVLFVVCSMKKLLKYFLKPVYNRTKDIEEIIVKTLKMLFAVLVELFEHIIWNYIVLSCKIVGFLRKEVNLL